MLAFYILHESYFECKLVPFTLTGCSLKIVCRDSLDFIISGYFFFCYWLLATPVGALESPTIIGRTVVKPRVRLWLYFYATNYLQTANRHLFTESNIGKQLRVDNSLCAQFASRDDTFCLLIIRDSDKTFYLIVSD